MIYENQPLYIEITCTVNGSAMTDAASAVINYFKPDKTTGQWAATLNGSKVEYKATIDLPGPWKIQPVVTFSSGDAIPGETISFTVNRRFS